MDNKDRLHPYDPNQTIHRSRPYIEDLSSCNDVKNFIYCNACAHGLRHQCSILNIKNANQLIEDIVVLLKDSVKEKQNLIDIIHDLAFLRKENNELRKQILLLKNS